MPIYALVLTSPPATPALSDFAVDRAWGMIPQAQRREQRWLAPREAWEAIFATNDIAAMAELRLDVSTISTASRSMSTSPPPSPPHAASVSWSPTWNSTIIQQECIDEMADIVGLKPHISAITEAAMRGEIEFEAALRERVSLLKGLSEQQLQRVFDERIRLMPGARTLVATMRKHGAHTALVSGGFTFFTTRVASAAGFDTNHANTLEIVAGMLTGRVIEPILGKQAKLDQLLDAPAAARPNRPLTMAIGDGANDLAMIKAAGLGVAYRAKPIVAAEADASITHGDLTALLYLQGYAKDEFAAG